MSSQQTAQECPLNPTAETCGLAAAERLVEADLVAVSADLRAYPILRGGTQAIEVLTFYGTFSGDRGEDVAQFGCEACGRCVEVVDNDGELRAQLGDS